MTSLLGKIRTRGNWEVIIRPTHFSGTRVNDVSQLQSILEKTFVQFRGWDFPHVDRQKQIHIDLDWVGQELEWDLTLETWRFYQSGQFIHLSGMPIDWRDQSSLWPASQQPDWKPNQYLDVVETVYRHVEIFEFASRLAFTEAGNDRMNIEIRLAKLSGRRLWLHPHVGRMPFIRPYQATIEKYPQSVELDRTDLTTHPRNHAMQFSLDLFKRFGWDPSPDLIRELQSGLKNNRGN